MTPTAHGGRLMMRDRFVRTGIRQRHEADAATFRYPTSRIAYRKQRQSLTSHLQDDHFADAGVMVAIGSHC